METITPVTKPIVGIEWHVETLHSGGEAWAVITETIRRVGDFHDVRREWRVPVAALSQLVVDRAPREHYQYDDKGIRPITAAQWESGGE